jgi:hypothetical protein
MTRLLLALALLCSAGSDARADEPQLMAATNNVARKQTIVPSTPHVRAKVPPGLQAWLNADPRMGPWLTKALAVVDSCYAELRTNDPTVAGVVEFSVTMHPNARPSATLRSLPAPLRGIVLCVTTQLLGVKMPLFTGSEGDRQIVRVTLTP